MAARVYYGKCTSDGIAQNKQVIVSDITINNYLQEGDLLVVYFTNKNTHTEPKLVLYNELPQEEESISSDEGKFIKTKDVDVDVKELWESGETVIFCYTLAANQTNTYYWEVIDGVKATTDVFGVTKLASYSGNFISWLNTEATEDDITVITPTILKEFYNTLLNLENEQDSGIGWVPIVGNNLESVGTLKILGQSLDITYPIEERLTAALIDIPTKTSDLTNDGNGNLLKPFITEDIPEHLYFTGGTSIKVNNAIAFTPDFNDNETHYIRIGEPINTDNPYFSGIQITGPTSINGNLSSGAITANGKISSNNDVEGINLKASLNIYEKNTTLEEKYSTQFVVKKYHSPIITLNPNNSSSNKGGIIEYNGSSTADEIHWKRPGGEGTSGNNHLYIVKTDYDDLFGGTDASNDWEPIGIVGHNIDGTTVNNVSYKDTSRYCHLWELHLWPTTSTSDTYNRAGLIEYSLFNTMPTTAKVVVDIYILFRKKLSSF